MATMAGGITVKCRERTRGTVRVCSSHSKEGESESTIEKRLTPGH